MSKKSTLLLFDNGSVNLSSRAATKARPPLKLKADAIPFRSDVIHGKGKVKLTRRLREFVVKQLISEKRLLKKYIRLTLVGAGHASFSRLDKALAKDASSYSPPCFIIGAPRSGTTLLYDLLVTRYRFSYFTNLANMFFLTPISISYIGKMFSAHRRKVFSSNYGTIKGLTAPSEAGNIWNRWIPQFDHLDENAINNNGFRREISGVLGAIQRMHKAPFINKNVMHGVHIRLLDAVFPGCLFIEIQRDIKSNVRSIVRARLAGGGPNPDPEQWWSVKPQNVESYYGLSFEEQAVAQIVNLRSDIDDSCKLLSGNRRITISYEELCQNPGRTLEKIRSFVEPVCGVLSESDFMPEKLEPAVSLPLSDMSEKMMASTLVQLGVSS